MILSRTIITMLRYSAVTRQLTLVADQRRQFIGAAHQFGAVEVPETLGQEASAGTFEDSGKRLEFDLCGIRRWNKVLQSGLQIFRIDGGILFQGALHPCADENGFDVRA